MSLAQTIEWGEPWLVSVSRGDFSVIPDPLRWDEVSGFSHLINGYTASINAGLGELPVWANERNREAAKNGYWRGTCFELWCCLFYERRRYRHFGEDPSGADLMLLNTLCSNLRLALQNATEEERAFLVHSMLSAP
jgi:hypothetical protein